MRLVQLAALKSLHRVYDKQLVERTEQFKRAIEEEDKQAYWLAMQDIKTCRFELRRLIDDVEKEYDGKDVRTGD